MSTRSRIGMEYTDKNGNRRVKSIYCNFDGYPDGNGKKLIDHYLDREKVKELIALGSINYVEKEVKPKGPHTFDKPEAGVTVAYHRDRDEEFQQLHFSSVQDYFAKFDEQYAYLFTDEGEWLVSGGDEVVPVTYVLSGVENI